MRVGSVVRFKEDYEGGRCLKGDVGLVLRFDKPREAYQRRWTIVYLMVMRTGEEVGCYGYRLEEIT